MGEKTAMQTFKLGVKAVGCMSEHFIPNESAQYSSRDEA